MNKYKYYELFLLKIDVPGFSHDEIVIECEADGTLTIKSEKKEDKEEKGENDKKADDDKDKKNVIVKGRNYHSFQYSFKFPSLDKVEATFKNSVLTVNSFINYYDILIIFILP